MPRMSPWKRRDDAAVSPSEVGLAWGGCVTILRSYQALDLPGNQRSSDIVIKPPAAVAGDLSPREPPIAPSLLNHGLLLGHVLRRSTCFGSYFWVQLRSLSG